MLKAKFSSKIFVKDVNLNNFTIITTIFIPTCVQNILILYLRAL